MLAAGGAGAGAGRAVWLLARGAACLADGAGDGENSPACESYLTDWDLIMQITRYTSMQHTEQKGAGLPGSFRTRCWISCALDLLLMQLPTLSASFNTSMR